MHLVPGVTTAQLSLCSVPLLQVQLPGPHCRGRVLVSPLPGLVQSCHPPGRAPGSRSSVSPGSHPREAQEPATVTPLPLAPRPCNISVSLLSNSASYQVFNLPLQVVYVVRQEVGLRPFRSLDTANRAHAKSTHCARFHRLALPNWSLGQPKRVTEIVCLTAQYEVVKMC